MAKTLCIALKSTALVPEVRHKLLSHSGSEATLEEFAPFLIMCCFRRASSSIEKNLLIVYSIFALYQDTENIHSV